MARPKSGTALTSAERQRRYRAREAARIDDLVEAFHKATSEARERCDLRTVDPMELAKEILRKRGREVVMELSVGLDRVLEKEKWSEEMRAIYLDDAQRRLERAAQKPLPGRA